MDCTILTQGVLDPKRNYYVYRLIDPRTYQTFYVGKGKGDRAFQHVKDAKSLISKDEDELSLKISLILDIIASGKQVIIVIHRRGLTNKEALEVEAALIDCYPGLTNVQRGHGYDRGAITIEDLKNLLSTPVYIEPEEKYIIIKVRPEVIASRGGIYEAVHYAWRANLQKASKYKYVLAVVNGIVREVFEVDRWYYYPNSPRIAFDGNTTNDSISALKNRRIPSKYQQKGSSNPFLYKKK